MKRSTIFQNWQCFFRLYHKWGDPTITETQEGKQIVRVCERCGKRSERIIPPARQRLKRVC